MMHDAFSDLVKDGGISAPAWAFFTAILLGIGGLLREAISTRRKIDGADTKIDLATTAIDNASTAATDASTAAKMAAQNTHTVGNGFVARQDANFTALFTLVSRIDGKFEMLDRKLEKIIEVNDLKREEPS